MNKLKRTICYLFHWRRQLREADTHYYGWKCGVCGERWRVQRADTTTTKEPE
jgi:hypothetical protein